MKFIGLVKIHVKTNASENKVFDFNETKQAWNVSIKAPAQDNKANLEIIKFFTKLSKRKVKIKSGLKSKEKLLLFS